ncbi:NAD(P)H:quinone oxidoreductase, type IV [Phytophthora nicotianae P10297]|uniref:NAD(P)H:quinone oxidoreductase, type IV n=5 Tax=Phytophthora nicotianae TaxID=4792 RepID=W2RHP1_PHYN3|nr:NAD(P)H:quinone oxidoreductase, type IV [Phytophthora nicotianae INRA-310]ETI56983.1 NAD(P)H:quinone oxidoreductase, type IV [Phytophthora nicotianae P1569]ETK96755.1 NAD(P)H:quinone oxidoreductase, type IV [Phytophthora nicotianae]ETO85730.1 NAD(P)H:quinone oxidoreductase, type IV [Phytophthora nicotianae P1976]ETP54749.1 NAD(P)H:quinone oxidoreductase, type IV [Phytophthora nicotianae P10297]KUF85038.1 Flavoprotein YCP4 [Phytophthora nicotianae]
MTVNVAIIYYSIYGHAVTLAEAVKEGVDSVQGVKATIYQVPETLSEEILTKMHAPPKRDYPVATPQTLKEADGILFGYPTRFGDFPAQAKNLFDATGQLWAAGDLIGKPGGCFVSTSLMGAGQETTQLMTMAFMTSHGMTFVPLGYRAKQLFNVDEVHGGSPWGAGTIAGPDNSRQVSKLEKDIAMEQGKSFAEVTKKLSS